MFFLYSYCIINPKSSILKTIKSEKTEPVLNYPKQKGQKRTVPKLPDKWKESEKMKYNQTEIKKGISLHQMNTEKFKTNLIAIFLSSELTRENVTKNAVLSSVLRRGSKNLKTQEEISKKMEEMYGAEYNCGLDKIGKKHVLKFYIE